MTDVVPVAAKIVKHSATNTYNYWSPLACLVEEQEKILKSNDTNTSVDWAMNATTDISWANKVAAHWAQQIKNRKLHKMGILDTGATSGAAPEEDEECFVDTGEASTKTFMFPDKRTNKATKRMLTKHNLCPAAREMNIVPGLHSTLISVPKLADAGYTMVFSKAGVAIYDDYTTTILASNPPVLDANRCDRTGLWKLPLDDNIKETDMNLPTHEAINAIFDLPSARQTFLWYHASAGFPVKESFIKAVRNGNYATWPKLTITLINKYMPDSDETVKGHLKGQCQGIRSTKHNAFTALVEAAATRLKIEGESSPIKPLPPTKFNDIFVRMVDLTDEIHTNQTGAFPHTSQRGNRYIMVGGHPPRCKLHLCGTYEEQVRKGNDQGIPKIINRMNAAGLGLQKQVLDNECSAMMKCIQGNGMTYELIPPGQHRRNQAERAIQTFKSHFISILAGVDNEFPLSLWCHLLEPTELTLNLLRQSQIAPNVSAFTHVHGNHD
jgi:hypothetical protein